MTTLSPMPRAPDLTGHILQGRYELHALIGEGAFGRVYRGRDRRLARSVAVKVIKPWWAEDPVWVERFAREAQLLAQINDPGIVQIYDVGEAPEGLYYVAELVDGESLAERLRRGRLAPERAAVVAEQLCRALGCAHERGIVHRDVKPANILIGAGGDLKVGDFGVARATHADAHAGASTVIGTPQYMSPEQARGEATTPASDVYGAGVVLYEMLAGHPPFAGEAAVLVALHHLRDAPPPLPGDVPRSLQAVVDRALAKQPADRYADGAQMARALAAAAGGASPAQEAAPAARRRRPRPDPATAALATAVRPREPAHGATRRVPDDARPTDRLAEPVPAATMVAPGGVRAGRAAAGATRRMPKPRRRRVRGAHLPVLGVLALAGGAALLALLLAAPGQTTVPRVLGLHKQAAAAVARRDHLDAVFHTRFADSERGTAFAQLPAPGSRARDGSAVTVMISAGPPPVAVPDVRGLDSTDAGARLQADGLRDTVMAVPAPGVAAGTVTSEQPRPPARAAAGSVVALQVAEAPRWRTLTTFSGSAGGTSVPFRILGSSWQVLTHMSYQGTCTFLIVCFGPHLSVANLDSSPSVSGFDLSDGASSQVFHSGPGTYQLKVSPGEDSANWTITVQDHY